MQGIRADSRAFCLARKAGQIAKTRGRRDCLFINQPRHLGPNLADAFLERVEGKLGVLSNLDEVAVGITHVAAPFPAIGICERLGKKSRASFDPLFVTGPDVGDAQVEEAADSVEIRRRFEEDLGLVGSWAAARIEDDPTVRQLDVAGVFRLDQFPAKNADVEVA